METKEFDVPDFHDECSDKSRCLNCGWFGETPKDGHCPNCKKWQ